MNDATNPAAKTLIPATLWRLLLAAALVVVALLSNARADSSDCAPDSWIFMQGRYTHDLESGVRVAQYAMKPPIEPLPDTRLVTSGYSRSRTTLRGADGSANSYYRVQSYGNGRGGMDAEWERFHDAWRGSTIAGGSYQTFPQYGYGYGGYGGFYGTGYGGPGYGGPGYGGPGAGGPGYGGPGVGGPGYGGPGYGGPGYGGGHPGGFAPRNGFGPGQGFGVPDYQRLDPDAADGYRLQKHRTPDRAFFSPGFPVPKDKKKHGKPAKP